MTVTPEIVAKLIFATTQLRFFEKEYLAAPDLETFGIVTKWQAKVDEILERMEMKEFLSYEELINSLKILNP